MLTMAFLEFLLSGFKTASKPRASTEPGFSADGVGPPNSLDCHGFLTRLCDRPVLPRA
jgi:hypothetical protein